MSTHRSRTAPPRLSLRRGGPAKQAGTAKTANGNPKLAITTSAMAPSPQDPRILEAAYRAFERLSRPR